MASSRHIIIGAIIGALGRLVVPGRQSMPVWLTIVVGIVAALLGSVIAGALGVQTTPGVDWIEIFIQVVLAAIGVAIVAGATGRRSLGYDTRLSQRRRAILPGCGQDPVRRRPSCAAVRCGGGFERGGDPLGEHRGLVADLAQVGAGLRRARRGTPGRRRT